MYPDSHSYTQLKSCNLTRLCLRDKLYRDAAPVPFSNFIYREKFPAVYQTCTAIAPALNKTCTWMAKSTPYLSCTGTVICLKYRDAARCLRQVTQPPFIAGPLGCIGLPLPAECFIMTLTRKFLRSIIAIRTFVFIPRLVEDLKKAIARPTRTALVYNSSRFCMKKNIQNRLMNIICKCLPPLPELSTLPNKRCYEKQSSLF
jgi:hypothetical protein